MRPNGHQDGKNCSETATHIDTEPTLLPPIALYSHSIVPGGFDVTS